MNINEIALLKVNIRGQLTNKQIAPICLAGSPGTAKSTTVRLVAEQLGMNIVTQSAPILTHELLTGLPDTVDAEQYAAFSIDGSKPKITVWSIPELIATTIRAAETKPTVLLIDDFHMVSPHLQAYFYGILLERRLGNFSIPNNVALVLTMNNSDAAGFHGINSAVRNRMAILQVEFNFEHWFKSYGNSLHYLVASFLKAKPHYCSEPEASTITGYATARAWTAIAAELSQHEHDFAQSAAGQIAGMQVSAEAARAFQTHVAYVAAIDFTNLVKSRTIVDLATKDPIDTIIYSYITNFIHTVADGMYLFDLMNKNKGEATSTFVGFVLGELYIKFTQKSTDKPIADGIRFVIDRITGTAIDKSNYLNPSALDKVSMEPIENLDIYRKLGFEFLM